MSGDEKAGLGPGSLVADYRIIDVLGAGGSGTVYRAQRTGRSHSVALKVMNAEHLDDDSERQRFEREAEVVKRLAHPHVVSLVDYGYAEGLPYLVFPLLEGRTLEQRLTAEGAVGWSLTGRFAEQVLSALEIAHGMGIAHRDIKPANIFLCNSPMGEITQILDFGTAKIVGDKTQQEDVTRVGVLVGTPRYMAPEQVRLETLTPAADVYAFGLVMAEMLTGKPLVTGASDFDMFVAQGSDRAHVLPEEILASPFASVIERAIAKPLEVRYRLASQMLADIRAIRARFGEAGGAAPAEADMEATSFFGMAPEPAAPNEDAMKLRKAFNAIAAKNPAPAPAPKPPPPAPGPPAAAPIVTAPAPIPEPPPPPPPTPMAAPAPPPTPQHGYALQPGMQQGFGSPNPYPAPPPPQNPAGMGTALWNSPPAGYGPSAQHGGYPPPRDASGAPYGGNPAMAHQQPSSSYGVQQGSQNAPGYPQVTADPHGLQPRQGGWPQAPTGGAEPAALPVALPPAKKKSAVPAILAVALGLFGAVIVGVVAAYVLKGYR